MRRRATTTMWDPVFFRVRNRHVYVSATMTEKQKTHPIGPGIERPHQRWNYTVHILDGGFFGGSQAFLNANTVLPALVLSLGGPNWLIALMPVAMLVGLTIPPMFVAHRIDSLTRYRPLLLVTGVLQRLPYLIAGVILLYGSGSRGLMVSVVACAPFLAGLACGVGLTAWQQLLADTLPPKRRSSALAGRNLLAGMIGLGAGWVVTRTLAVHPGPRGYGLLHVYTFVVLCISYAFFAMVRELPHADRGKTTHRCLGDNIKSLPALLRGTPGLPLYLAITACTAGIFVVAPFLVVHVKQSLHKPDSWLGQMVMVQMAGSVVGNIWAAWLGDRRGGKAVLISSQAALILSILPVCIHPGDGTAFLAFFCFGVAYNTRHVGSMTLALDLAPRRQRATVLSCIGMVGLVSMLCASLAGTLLFGTAGSFFRPAVVAGGLAVLTALLLVRLREPRHGVDDGG